VSRALPGPQSESERGRITGEPEPEPEPLTLMDADYPLRRDVEGTLYPSDPCYPARGEWACKPLRLWITL